MMTVEEAGIGCVAQINMWGLLNVILHNRADVCGQTESHIFLDQERIVLYIFIYRSCLRTYLGLIRIEQI